MAHSQNEDILVIPFGRGSFTGTSPTPKESFVVMVGWTHLDNSQYIDIIDDLKSWKEVIALARNCSPDLIKQKNGLHHGTHGEMYSYGCKGAYGMSENDCSILPFANNDPEMARLVADCLGQETQYVKQQWRAMFGGNMIRDSTMPFEILQEAAFRANPNLKEDITPVLGSYNATTVLFVKSFTKVIHRERDQTYGFIRFPSQRTGCYHYYFHIRLDESDSFFIPAAVGDQENFSLSPSMELLFGPYFVMHHQVKVPKGMDPADCFGKVPEELRAWSRKVWETRQKKDNKQAEETKDDYALEEGQVDEDNKAERDTLEEGPVDEATEAEQDTFEADAIDEQNEAGQQTVEERRRRAGWMVARATHHGSTHFAPARAIPTTKSDGMEQDQSNGTVDLAFLVSAALGIPLSCYGWIGWTHWTELFQESGGAACCCVVVASLEGSLQLARCGQ
ncbi:hypothetical protein SEMRO_1470_G275380.1 [Seminavis robusta]|uniref:Uncharacterized protein n=1 Tax=Seminavis robusta TaxID=568900 RepID=A0A9N8ERQ6_9STRA|nr:hypothetical protein SEMRO_1470_G275380.1 [Seminavis robusta]|eukprot:Sro1470_g275380.1 n/a (450) ;mRNA; f:19380-20954